MGRLIDTTIIVAIERKKLTRRVLDTPPGLSTDFISVVTLSELLVGVHRASAERRPSRQEFVESVISTVRVIPIDEAIARQHARLHAAVQASGTSIAPHDLWIAATAVQLGLEVLTLDMASFPLIPGLKLAALP